MVDLRAAPLTEAERFDAQYRLRRRYRGIPLQWVWEAAFGGRTAEGRARAGSDSVDLALLHFANGMVVPLKYRDASVMQRLMPFVATEIWAVDPQGISGWSCEFPDIRKKGEESEDWRPIRFQGNKLVVETLWHPDLSAATLRVFSPWAHVDTLVGIEFAESEAYWRQFQGPNVTAVRDGFRVYYARCQFCHGVREVGATFGWDFAVPVPLHTYRDPHNLLFHAKYREMTATQRGLMMPAFSDLDAQQVGSLWQWMEAIVSTGGPASYSPEKGAATASP